MHFGSLEDFSEVKLSPIKIAKSLRFPKQTVRNVIERFRKNGNKLESHRSKCGQKKMVIPQEVREYLLS